MNKETYFYTIYIDYFICLYFTNHYVLLIHKFQLTRNKGIIIKARKYYADKYLPSL